MKEETNLKRRNRLKKCSQADLILSKQYEGGGKFILILGARLVCNLPSYLVPSLRKQNNPKPEPRLAGHLKAT